MALALGVDTGGTYTDAVLIRDEREVIASAKSLTTRADLAIGVGKAIQAVLDAAQVAPEADLDGVAVDHIGDKRPGRRAGRARGVDLYRV